MAGKTGNVRERVRAQRGRIREKTFQQARGLQEGISRKSGASVIGRDENGMSKETRLPRSFGIVIDRWYVAMGFKREDRSLIEKPWQDAEAVLKEGDAPRSKVQVETHIIPAVRMLKHVRRSYGAELSRTDALVDALEGLNVALAVSETQYSDATLKAALETLHHADSGLAKKQVAVKRLVSRARIAKMASMIEKAMAMPEKHRHMEVSRACAVLVSVIDRLGQWRDRQVGHLMEHNLQKECSLRMERDRWLFSFLSRMAEDTSQIYWFWTMDADKLSVLDEISRMLSSGVPKGQLLSFMEDNHGLFRVAGRRRDQAERYVSLCEEGIQPRVGIDIDYMIGHYAWLYRHIRGGEMGKASRKIGHLRLFVNANKPSYVTRELAKDPDSYLSDVICPMREAVDAFESGTIPAARSGFQEALASLRPFVYPSR